MVLERRIRDALARSGRGGCTADRSPTPPLPKTDGSPVFAAGLVVAAILAGYFMVRSGSRQPARLPSHHFSSLVPTPGARGLALPTGESLMSELVCRCATGRQDRGPSCRIAASSALARGVSFEIDATSHQHASPRHDAIRGGAHASGVVPLRRGWLRALSNSWHRRHEDGHTARLRRGSEDVARRLGRNRYRAAPQTAAGHGHPFA